MRWLALLVLFAPVVTRAAECRLDGPAYVIGGVGDHPLARVVDARRGETLTAHLVVAGTLAGRAVLFSDAPERRFTSWARAGCGAISVTWRRVEPTMMHTISPPPNRENATYSNAVIFGPHHGEWIGWDRIEYLEGDLDGGGFTRAVVDARPGDPRFDTHDGLGTMRLAATVSAGGRRVATPGALDRDGPGIADRVFRYTFRRGDDFLGWLTSYFNVPYLFGSAGHFAKAQAERYVGADCADVLVAALRRAGRRDLDYSSVAQLITLGRRVAGPVLVDGSDGAAPAPVGARLAWGSAVRPGDLLVIDYVGWAGTPRQWDHVLVAVEDRGPGGGPGDGWLGPEDVAADSGDASGLIFQALARQGKIEVLVLRIPSDPRSRS
ncbi:MAG: hypothetical protein EXR72_22525 [Myxococcales bacterium]|nr:hypothetical protein [Myxococcales bacterium]